jgi:hypothetical protein
MTPEIKDILEDIYELEPALREREAEVIALVEELLAARPVVEMSEEFRSSLREEVLREFEAEAAAPEKTIGVLPAYLHKIAFALGGAAVALVLIFPFVMNRQGQPAVQQPTGGLELGLDSAQPLGLGGGGKSIIDEFVDLGSHAFGSLNFSSGESVISAPSEISASDPTAAVSEEVTIGRGGGGAAGSGTAGSSGTATAVPSPSPKRLDNMIIYDPIGFVFKYAGEPLQLSEGNIEVLKRIKRVDAAGAARIVGSLDLGLVDIKSLSDIRVNNIGLSEDHDFGYDLQVDLREGIMYLNQNYPRWQIGPGCEKGICNNLPTLSPSAAPSNEEIIKIADDFIAELGISREGYDAPKVDDNWRNQAPPAPDQPVYVPDYIQVKYPLAIKDQPVYGGPGYEVGLDVTVDIRHEKVSNLGPIMSRRYETSSYEGETDAARIISIAEEGGYGGGWLNPDAEDKVTLELETPTFIYLQQYSYDGYESSELYVPALLFPIKDWQQKGFWNSGLVVPLAKEMLDQHEQNFPGPVPMPLIEPAPAEQVK